MKSRTASEKLLGQILAARGVVSRKQLDLALRIKDVQPDKYLGEILLRIGVPQEKINRALFYFHKRKSLGEVLLDLEMISYDQLKETLTEQKRRRSKGGPASPLGLLLIELGYIDIRGYLTALSKHFNMPILSLRDHEPDPLLQKTIGKRYALERRLIVLEDSGKVIRIALAEPSVEIMEELCKAVPSGKWIEFYLASHTAIDECFSRMQQSP